MKAIRRVSFLLIISVILFTGCTKSYSADDYDENNLVDINEMVAGPEETAGKSAKFYMQVFGIDSDAEGKVILGYTNSSFDADEVILRLPKDGDIGEVKEGDYLYVEGVNIGASDGGKVQISANDKTKVSTYKDAASPTLESIELNKEDTQNKVSTKVTLIEETPIETRLYVTIDNQSSSAYSISDYDFALIVDGKQYAADTNYDAEYPELMDDIQPGVSYDAILSFPKIDLKNSKKIDLNIDDGYSDNFDLDFKAIKFNLK